jgi:AraC-like DNA-binding protein
VPLWCESTVLVSLRQDAPGAVIAHGARPEWQMVFVQAGGATMATNGATHGLAAGTVILLPPGNACHLTVGEAPLASLWVRLPRLPPECPRPARVTCLPQGEELLPWLLRLEEWSRRGEADGEAELLTLATFCVQLFLRLARREGTAPELDWLERTQHHVKQHLAEVLTIPDLAGIAGLSEAHFRRQFRQQTGQGPLEYIRRLRVCQAVGLLQQTRLTLREIAGVTGFTDERYLARVVGECTGHSPSAWRALSHGASPAGGAAARLTGG